MQSQLPKNYVLDARRTTKGVQSLMGIVSGLVCDGELNDNEILYLRTWMTEPPRESRRLVGFNHATAEHSC